MDSLDRSYLAVGVVDSDRRRFDALCSSIAQDKATFHFYTNGREALRHGMVDCNAVWLINVRLPDMTGFDLHEMLRDRLNGAAVCLVAEVYRQEDEIRTYCTGAAMYACRPIERAWLRESIQRLRFAGRPRPVIKSTPVPWSDAKPPTPLRHGVCEVGWE